MTTTMVTMTMKKLLTKKATTKKTAAREGATREGVLLMCYGPCLYVVELSYVLEMLFMCYKTL